MIPEFLKRFLRRRFPAHIRAYRDFRDVAAASTSAAVQTPLGFRFVGNADMQRGTYEPEQTALVSALLSDADVFVDVGANIGYYTCLARAAGKHVIAFEPVPANVQTLLRNLQVNDWNNVEVFPVGVAEQTGVAQIFGAGSAASLLERWRAMPGEPFHRSIPLLTLDQLLPARFAGKRMLIKMDVEGAEASALRGAVRTLAMRPAPVWIVEISAGDPHPNGINEAFHETFEMFWHRGYRAYTADTARRTVGAAEVARWAADRTPAAELPNFLFVMESLAV